MVSFGLASIFVNENGNYYYTATDHLRTNASVMYTSPVTGGKGAEGNYNDDTYYNDNGHTGWDPSMGFTSMFGMITNVYGSMAALNGYGSGYSSGAGMGFGSGFAGRGFSITQRESTGYLSSKTWAWLGNPNNGQWVETGSSQIDVYTEGYQYERGQLEANYWSGGMNESWGLLGGKGFGSEPKKKWSTFFNSIR